jgi:hypothetical protein
MRYFNIPSNLQNLFLTVLYQLDPQKGQGFSIEFAGEVIRLQYYWDSEFITIKPVSVKDSELIKLLNH